MDISNHNSEAASRENKNKELYLKQKKLLQTFLEHGAISKSQYEKSLGDLTEKMGMQTIF